MIEKHFVQQITIDEQIAEVKREIAMRNKVYPKWIEAGSLPKAKSRFSNSRDGSGFDFASGNRQRKSAASRACFECLKTADSITIFVTRRENCGAAKGAKKSFIESRKTNEF